MTESTHGTREPLDADEARTRIAVALQRIADLPTMDNPDEMIACISDVEAILNGEDAGDETE